jgi:hypothetical protein
MENTDITLGYVFDMISKNWNIFNESEKLVIVKLLAGNKTNIL